MEKNLLLLLFCVFATDILAQNRVFGTVTNAEDGISLPGVSITVKGTSSGITTDANGKYSLSATAANVLVFSYVGFDAREVRVGNQTTINISLTPDNKTLQEVQIVAFGEQRKRDVTGSIVSLKSADIRANTAASPDVALQGRAAGVQITQAGGTPGRSEERRVGKEC